MRAIQLLAISMGVLILALQFYSNQLLPWAIVAVAIGALWINESRRGNGWASHFGLVFLVALIFYGIYLEFNLISMMLATLVFLFAWDLETFTRKLMNTPGARDARLMWQNHVTALMLIGLLSLISVLFVQAVQFELGFWLILLIAAAGMIALTRALIAFQREVD